MVTIGALLNLMNKTMSLTKEDLLEKLIEAKLIPLIRDNPAAMAAINDFQSAMSEYNQVINQWNALMVLAHNAEILEDAIIIQTGLPSQLVPGAIKRMAARDKEEVKRVKEEALNAIKNTILSIDIPVPIPPEVQ